MIVLRYLGYVCFFLCSFVVGLYLTFPWEAAKDRVLEMISKTSGMEITASSLKPSWLTGVVAKELKIKPKRAEEPIEINEIHARAHVLELITGGIGVTVHLPIASGTVDADVVQDDAGIDVAGTIDNIELALVPGFKDAVGIPLGGKLSADVDLYLGLKDATLSDGTITLKGTGLEILKGGKISGFPIPELGIGDFAWEVAVKKGKAKFDKQRIAGENLQLVLEGEIAMQSPPSRSKLNMTISFKPTDAFLKKEPLLGALLNNIKRAKGSDGFYTYALTGSIKHPRFFPRRKR